MPTQSPARNNSYCSTRKLPRLPLKFEPNVNTLDRSSVLRYRAIFEIKEVVEISQKYKEKAERRRMSSVSPFRSELIGFDDNAAEHITMVPQKATL